MAQLWIYELWCLSKCAMFSVFFEPPLMKNRVVARSNTIQYIADRHFDSFFLKQPISRDDISGCERCTSNGSTPSGSQALH